MTRLQKIARIAGPLVRDLIGLAGLALVITGVGAISEAAAMILGGSLMVALCLLWARCG